MNRAARAFTLVELLVVVGIIGMLVGMLVPSFVTVADLAREASCLGNLREISRTAGNYMMENKSLLPKNDATAGDYLELSEYNRLPGQDSTLRWWCNKIYTYGDRRPALYICPSDPGRASDADAVQCGYGFNNTLTDPAPGDEVKLVGEIEEPELTAIIGHCSDYSREPAIMEEMVLKGEGKGYGSGYWPRGHMAKYDTKAKAKAGRCGFIMASGAVAKRTFTQAISLENVDGKPVLFRKAKRREPK